METPLSDHRISTAAPIVFIIVVVFQFISKWLEQLKKRGGPKSATEIRLRKEIKEMLREASTLSQPSTFAQAAKLRRMAAAKEKEIVKYQELHGKDERLSCEMYMKILFISKVATCLVLIYWFWSVPVASIPQQLVQPFGKMMSWRAGGVVNENVKVGIIPWLILSTRVSKFVCRLFKL